jgi:kynurenine formamidase
MDRRVKFDFEVEFLNGGGLQGQDFRLDIDGADLDDDALADYIVRDLRLLMAGPVRILNKSIIVEPHKRRGAPLPAAHAATALQAPALDDAPLSATASEPEVESPAPAPRLIDLSHTIEAGMITYQGLPAPIVCDYLSREASREHYAEGTEFQIGRIELVGNTGTYLDSPFHRFAAGKDLSELELEWLAGLPGVVVRVTGLEGRAIGRSAFAATEVRGKAVLVHTGWSAYWRTERYFEGHPYLTEDAALYLRDAGAVLVGIDSLNIDDIGDPRRPVHTTLLGAEIPIVEHLRGLEELPITGFYFSAVPVKIKGMGTFPVRAYAVLQDRP